MPSPGLSLSQGDRASPRGRHDDFRVKLDGTKQSHTQDNRAGSDGAGTPSQDPLKPTCTPTPNKAAPFRAESGGRAARAEAGVTVRGEACWPGWDGTAGGQNGGVQGM